MFPVAPWVVDGQERGSAQNREYALRDTDDPLRGDAAARAFLRFESGGQNLRANYLEMMTAVAEQLEAGIPIRELVGGADEPKLISSATLFAGAGDPEVKAVCDRVLAHAE